MNCIRICLTFALVLASSAVQPGALPADEPVPVSVKKSADGGWQLFRAGKPYRIRGAGGEGPLDLLAEYGGNSTRTWGVGDDTLARLDEAHRNGITVTLGIWIEHERHGHDYTDFDFVTQQIDKTVAAVKKYRNHPALLAWGIGNEMEGAIGDNPVIWTHIEYLARLVKQLDPHHPTMTVIAEIGSRGEKVKAINKLCPSIDIIGVNSYGGAASLPQRFSETNSEKPYIVTEFGPLGQWEVEKNNLDVVDEKTSTEKAATYLASYRNFAKDKRNLGSYAFLWGNKMEATETWFGILLPDGRKTAALDALSEAWTGKPVENQCPRIESLELMGDNQVKPGATLRFTLKATDPENDALNVDWGLMGDTKNYITGGDFQKSPPRFPDRIMSASKNAATVKAPDQPGLYRMYAYVGDSNRGAATANVVFRVDVAEGKFGRKADVPLVVYNEKGESRFYVPSGFMGDHEAIVVDDECRDNPKDGKTCLKNTFDRIQGWGGVVWQHPENDWGDKPGGLDLSDAKKLSFWVRGETGKERVKFGFGLLGRDKTFFDTGKKETEINLTRQWTNVTFDISKLDLRRIKTGFYWVVAADGKPITFYLDKIQFE